MPIDIDVRMVSGGGSSRNFIGTLRVSFPEMNILNRQLTFAASKMPRGLHIAVFRDGNALFSIDNGVQPPVPAINIDDEYGARDVTRVVTAFNELIGQSVEGMEEATVSDASATGIFFSFRFTDVGEGEEEIIYLMCRPPIKTRVQG